MSNEMHLPQKGSLAFNNSVKAGLVGAVIAAVCQVGWTVFGVTEAAQVFKESLPAISELDASFYELTHIGRIALMFAVTLFGFVVGYLAASGCNFSWDLINRCRHLSAGKNNKTS